LVKSIIQTVTEEVILYVRAGETWDEPGGIGLYVLVSEQRNYE
jgi:hypothetical protein